MSSEPLTFLIRHRPTLREWMVAVNEIGPNDMRFADECSPRSGAPGLVGAIGWCFRASRGRPSRLIIESRGQQYLLQFQGEVEDVATWGIITKEIIDPK